MSKVADPTARAQKAGTKVQAARLYQELEAELALGDHGDEWDANAEQALGHLESKAGEHEWGDLTDHEATIAYTPAGGGHRMAHGWAPKLSRSAGRNLDEGGNDAPRHLDNGAHPAGKPEPKPPKPGQRKHAVRRRAGARIRSRGGARRAYLGLGPPPLVGARQMAGTALWGALGLVMLYLLLRDAENPRRGWPSAVQTAVRSVTAFIDAIVRPVDPLNPRAKKTKTPTTAGSTPFVGPPAPQPTPAGPAGPVGPVGPVVSVGPPAPTPTPAGPAGPIGPS